MLRSFLHDMHMTVSRRPEPFQEVRNFTRNQSLNLVPQLYILEPKKKIIWLYLLIAQELAGQNYSIQFNISFSCQRWGRNCKRFGDDDYHSVWGSWCAFRIWCQFDGFQTFKKNLLVEIKLLNIFVGPQWYTQCIFVTHALERDSRRQL